MSARASVGILRMDNQIPRLLGDIGNPRTFAFPVEYLRIAGSTNQRVVYERDRALLEPYIEGARTLERSGASSITTTCGFLAMFQPELASSVRVPVFTSGLLLVPLVARMIGAGRRVGILTADSEVLTETHFNGAGWSSSDVPIAVRGMQDCPGFRGYIDDQPAVDAELIRHEMADAARALVREHPDVGAIVLECANMPAYADAVQAASGLPVFDARLLADMVHAATHRSDVSAAEAAR